MLIDTHVHLYHNRLAGDVDEAIIRAKEAGVNIMILPAIDVPSIGKAIELCEKHEGLFAMTALHPSEIKEATDADFEAVSAYCDHEKIIAVGESGLDYYWDRTFDEKQQDFFRRHIRLAIEKDLPLIIHNRDASEDTIRILSEEKAQSNHPERMRGILHCFGGPAEVGFQAIELGFHLGIGGTVTFKNSGVAEEIKDLPLNRIVIETDAPFLAPMPFRGKRNEPAYVKFVAEKLANVFGISFDEIADITSQNAKALFRLP